MLTPSIPRLVKVDKRGGRIHRGHVGGIRLLRHRNAIHDELPEPVWKRLHATGKGLGYRWSGN